MYGTTYTGGPGTAMSGFGTVWEITALGVYKVLHNFGGVVTNLNGQPRPDGIYSQGGVTIDKSGNLFGVADQGGSNAAGILWEITTAGTYIDLHDFGGTLLLNNGTTGDDGSYPSGSITLDATGNIYGATFGGGANGTNSGTVWELTKSGVYRDLHDFGGLVKNANGLNGPDGFGSFGSLAIDVFGNLYGSTSEGGPHTDPVTGLTDGILWRIDSSGVYSDIHDFGGTIIDASGQSSEDGTTPNSVSVDSAGNVYGTTQAGGPFGPGENGVGIIWKMNTFGDYVDLHDFGVQITHADGTIGLDAEISETGVTLDSAGNLYGATGFGGPQFVGVVWELTNSGVYRDLHDFGRTTTVENIGGKSGLDGVQGLSNIAFDNAGNLYGTAYTGGQNIYISGAAGIVWTIGSLQSVSVSSPNVAAGNKAIGTITLGRAAPIGGTVVNLSSSDPNAAPPATVKVPAGVTSVTFNILTKQVTATTPAVITASQGATTVTTPLTIQPVTLAGFSYFATPTGGTTETFRVDLNGPAPIGGLTVFLSSNNPLAPVPTSVSIGYQGTSATFTVPLGHVLANTPVVITGMLGPVTQTAKITITP